jgi:N6-adenosine-specific RNA methylase IME4
MPPDVPVRQLVPLDVAMQVIAEAESPAELADLSISVDAFRQYARRAKLGLSVQNRAAEIRLRCERRIGEMLGERELLRGRPKNGSGGERLSDLGIDRKLSMRAQRLAQVPLAAFDAFISDTLAAGKELYTRNLLNLFERQAAKTRNQLPMPGGQITDLHSLVRAGRKFGTVYCDVPWDVPGNPPPYPVLTFDELAALPIPELAAQRCHLHLWAGDRFFEPAFTLIREWRFRVTSTFVWVTDEIGRGNYWRSGHVTMLTAVNSKNDHFDDHSLRSWISAPRGRHSQKPDVVRKLLERSSPGPRLELFATSCALGWTSWGGSLV